MDVSYVRHTDAWYSNCPNERILAHTVRDFINAPINPFVSNAPFLYPLKTSGNRKDFSDVFRGQRKSALGTNGLSKVKLINIQNQSPRGVL